MDEFVLIVFIWQILDPYPISVAYCRLISTKYWQIEKCDLCSSIWKQFVARTLYIYSFNFLSKSLILPSCNCYSELNTILIHFSIHHSLNMENVFEWYFFFRWEKKDGNKYKWCSRQTLFNYCFQLVHKSAWILFS